MNDEADPRTADRLRRALRARDAEVMPSPDALARIRQRSGARATWRRRTPTLVAATVVVIAGTIGAIVLLTDDGNDPPDVATDDTTTTTSDAPTTSTTEPTTTSTSTPTTTAPENQEPTPAWLVDEGLIVWPRDSRSFPSMEAAAESYAADVLRIDDATIDYACCDDRTATAAVRARGESGEDLERSAAVLTLVETDGTWDIVIVQSDSVMIDRLTATPAGIVVAGRGNAFEGAAVVESTSRCDPDTSWSEPVEVGAGIEMTDFAAFAAAPACDVAIVGVLVPGVADGATPYRAEAAVRLDGGAEDVVVMRVAAEDGLNVRQGPGADTPVVTTLAPDGTDITRTGATDGDWWEIVTPDGVTGWAQSAYLSVQPVVDGSDSSGDLGRALTTFAARLVQALDEGSLDGVTGSRYVPPMSALGIDVGGIGVYADAPSSRRVDVETFFAEDVLVDWNPFPELPCDDECRRSVPDFLDLRLELLADAAFNTDPIVYDDGTDVRWSVGLPDLYTERFATVRIEIPSVDGGDPVSSWRTYTVVFDFRNDLPEIIAVWRWGWTP